MIKQAMNNVTSVARIRMATVKKNPSTAPAKAQTMAVIVSAAKDVSHSGYAS
jgi:hypothetical protein